MLVIADKDRQDLVHSAHVSTDVVEGGYKNGIALAEAVSGEMALSLPELFYNVSWEMKTNSTVHNL